VKDEFSINAIEVKYFVSLKVSAKNQWLFNQ